MKNLNIKYIWVLFFFILFILMLLQGVWIYNTYYMSRKDVENKINSFLAESIDDEVGLRFINLDKKLREMPNLRNDTLDFKFEYEVDKIGEDGLVTQHKSSMQKFLVHGGFPFEQGVFENIFSDKLNKEKIKANYSIQYIDSSEVIPPTENSIFRKKFFSDSFQIIDKKNVQATVEIPIPVMLERNMYIFVVSLFFLIVLIAFMIYIIRVIFTQNLLLRLRDDFTSALNHNMRNPLGLIYMAINDWRVGRWDNDTEKRNRTISIATKQVKNLLSIVDTILSISRYEYNKIVLDKSVINMQEIIDWIKDKYSLPSDNKTISISTDYNVNEQVIADEIHLISVIENLIDNAIKYSGDTVEININCYTQSGRLYIKVKDNGYGISKKALTSIFEKFERGDALKRKEVKGVGLGLNYVKSLVEAHGGRVTVSSTVGVGSEFVIEIPIND